MTEETKKLFDAPWHVAKDNFDYAISSASNEPIVFDSGKDGEKNSKRIERLPELYDALHEAADGKCWSCAGVNVDTVLDKGCPKGHNGDCYVAKWIELLRKVRDGE